MTDSRSRPPNRKSILARVGPSSLTLVLLLLSCGRAAHVERSLGHDFTIEIDSPRASLRYPRAVPLRVTLRNRSDKPFTMTWPPDFRLTSGCTSHLQSVPVELWFIGNTLDRGFSPTRYRWHWKPTAEPPAQLVVAPGESRVIIDTVFRPPAGAHMLEGSFCARIYGHDLPCGVTYRGPGK